MKKLNTIGAIICIMSMQIGAFAQGTEHKIVTTAANHSNQAVNLEAPKNIAASDGVYDKFVLIRWEPCEGASQYKVFRSTSAKGAGLQEISNAWQKSTWLSDYSALPNVDYHYTVVASNGKSTSPIGALDKGFIKKSSAIAIEETTLLAENEAYGSNRKIFLLIASSLADKDAYRAGETINLNVILQNIFEEQAPRTEMRFYLSADGMLDWNDQLLGTKNLSESRANVKFEMKEVLRLPSNLLPGVYQLITVSSPEGSVLGSKTALTSIKIVAQ
jgi:hypothetical protein